MIKNLTIDELSFLFGIDFIRELNMEDFRDYRLNSILEDGR